MTLNELVAAMSPYRDSFNQLTQADGDLGDSLNRAGVYYSCLMALGVPDDLNNHPNFGFGYTLDAHRGSEPGRYRRGQSEKERWFNNENNVTRDQMVTVEAALALSRMEFTARNHFWKRAKRLFFHFSTQNDGADAGPLVRFKLPDLCTPDEFGTLIRATRYKILYPLLPLCDLWLLIMVKWGRKFSERSLYDADNQLLPCVLAAIDQPSFITEHVRRAYATTDAADRLRAYYSESNNRNGIEPLGAIAALAFERCVGGLKI